MPNGQAEGRLTTNARLKPQRSSGVTSSRWFADCLLSDFDIVTVLRKSLDDATKCPVKKLAAAGAFDYDCREVIFGIGHTYGDLSASSVAKLNRVSLARNKLWPIAHLTSEIRRDRIIRPYVEPLPHVFGERCG